MFSSSWAPHHHILSPWCLPHLSGIQSIIPRSSRVWLYLHHLVCEVFFQATLSAADRMLSQLETHPDMMGGAYIPMNTFILCSIFDPKSASFPATMTAFYQAFVHQTITQECSKKRKDLPLDPLLRYSLLPEDICCLLASLGVLSFKGLCQVPHMFIFSEYGSTPSKPSICSTIP